MPAAASLIEIPPGNLSRRNRALVAAVGNWKLVPFRELPDTHRRALAVHRRGPVLSGAALERAIGKDSLFGTIEFPMEALIWHVMRDPDRKSFEDWDDYHAFYVKKEKHRMKAHRTLWPIILRGDDTERETIWDGWHRFHAYHRSRFHTVPAIWYADE
jgi:hypothetical protein